MCFFMLVSSLWIYWSACMNTASVAADHLQRCKPQFFRKHGQLAHHAFGDGNAVVLILLTPRMALFAGQPEALGTRQFFAPPDIAHQRVDRCRKWRDAPEGGKVNDENGLPSIRSEERRVGKDSM